MKYWMNIMIKLILILTVLFVSCGNISAFDYMVELHGKRKIIKSYPISDEKKYLNFVWKGKYGY